VVLALVVARPLAATRAAPLVAATHRPSAQDALGSGPGRCRGLRAYDSPEGRGHQVALRRLLSARRPNPGAYHQESAGKVGAPEDRSSGRLSRVPRVPRVPQVPSTRRTRLPASARPTRKSFLIYSNCILRTRCT
jgi:hypothetical protein